MLLPTWQVNANYMKEALSFEGVDHNSKLVQHERRFYISTPDQELFAE